MNCSPSGSSVHGILQAGILEWVAIPFSRGSSWTRDWTRVSCLAGRFFITEPPGKPIITEYILLNPYCSIGGITLLETLYWKRVRGEMNYGQIQRLHLRWHGFFTLTLLKNQDYFFRKDVQSQQKWLGGTEIFHIPHCHHTCIASPIINMLHQSDTFVATDEPILVHHSHSKSTVYLRIHSWWCTFHRFGQMYNDLYLSLWYHTEYFHCLKNVLCSANSFSSYPLENPSNQVH